MSDRLPSEPIPTAALLRSARLLADFVASLGWAEVQMRAAFEDMDAEEIAAAVLQLQQLELVPRPTGRPRG